MTGVTGPAWSSAPEQTTSQERAPVTPVAAPADDPPPGTQPSAVIYRISTSGPLDASVHVVVPMWAERDRASGARRVGYRCQGAFAARSQVRAAGHFMSIRH